MKKPNFFIVGAGGCGTTALYEYLNSHPNIFMSNPKETHYFSTDISKESRVFTKLEQYLELFQKAGTKHIAVGEACPSYLYPSKEALRNIYQFNKSAKIIVTIRNPVDMVYTSYFSQLNFNGLNEDQESFEKAWHLQDMRRQGQMLPKYCREPRLLQYGQIGKLGEHLERVYSIFPQEHVKIIIFDDFITSTQKIYQEILSFLGVEDDNRTEFIKINDSKKVYNIRWLHVFTQVPPQFLSHILNHWKPIRDIKNSIVEQVNGWNSIKAERPPLDENFRKELEDFFHDDVKKLSELVGKDLMHWVESS